MRFPLVIRAAVFCAVALLVGTDSRADETREDRDRKARAALALTAPTAKVAAAPAPKAKSVAYADGYKRASIEQQPLVVFVGCPVEPVPGAVVSWAGEFRDVKAPAVVVGYPVGDRLYVHATLPGAPTAEAVQREVKAAAKKADPKPMPPREVKDAPAPKPLDWQIRADFDERRDARTELDYAMDSAARVRSGDSWGSGTVVYSEPGRSVILTAAHILKPGEAVEVRADGRNLEGRVILTDRAADLAAVEVRRQLPHVAVVDDELAEGDDVLLVGAASVWSRGKVSGFTSHNDRTVAVLTYESYSGDSGGAVFRGGHLVAVHTGGHRGAKTAARNLVAFTARAIRAETLNDRPTTQKPAALPDCPTGTCPLKSSPFAAPVTLPAGGCANGQCELPTTGRGGLFRRR